jgi:hypothetical protein
VKRGKPPILLLTLQANGGQICRYSSATATVVFPFSSDVSLAFARPLVDQSQEQLRAAYEQNAFNCREYEKQIAILLHDLIEAKYELAKRDREIAFAAGARRRRCIERTTTDISQRLYPKSPIAFADCWP